MQADAGDAAAVAAAATPPPYLSSELEVIWQAGPANEGRACSRAKLQLFPNGFH